MLKNDVIWPPHRQYHSRTEWEPIGFFSDGLCHSERFDLMLGYFSSSAIQLLSYGFASFIYRGGKMRLIINDFVSIEDKDAIQKGVANIISSTFDLNNLRNIKDILSKRDRHFFDCLSYLISEGRIDIRIIVPKSGNGISHTKMGVFYDGVNKVSFSGSCNFSYTALVENIESIGVSCDWDSGTDLLKIDYIEKKFEAVFDGTDDTVSYVSADDLKNNLREVFPKKDLPTLAKEEIELIEDKTISPTIKDILHRTKEIVESQISEEENVYVGKTEPRFPFPQGPREYQQLAFDNWKDNKQQGLFAMATGTGKTITSLNCLLEIYKRKGYYKAIILVPTITLVNQWEQECLKFHFSNIIKVYSKNPSWREEVSRLLFDEEYKSENDPETSYIIMSTYASFSREDVFKRLNSFDKRRLMLIADECHNIGSETLLKRLKEIVYLRRIGLSATPERQFDERGNQKIRKFFGAVDNYTYEYSMEEAIKNGVLCRYMYYPHFIRLTDNEMYQYVELSEKIAKYFNYNSGTFDNVDEVLKMMLLARKRIIHKAENKLSAFQEIINHRFVEKGNLKYTLVYVPEGNKPDYIGASDDFDKSEGIEDDQETDHLIDLYTQVVLNVDEKTTVRKFVSGLKDRDEVLADFASGKLHVLTSMKCLDEGVDVPRCELAIFCSSTGNPRQFIQRRGRVLRTHPDKYMAELHDLVVCPEVGFNCSSFRIEQSLLRTELIRVNHFASLSENPSYSEIELRDVMDHYGLSLYNNEYI